MAAEQQNAPKTYRSIEEFRSAYFPKEAAEVSIQHDGEEPYGVRLAQTMLAKHAGEIHRNED
jgi:hypothetical protein